MTQKIFVTGGTGFVGSYLLRYLVKKGYTNISAVRRATSRMDLVAEVADKIEWLEGDILDVPFLEDALEGVTQVYHAAALISFDPKEVDKMQEINQKGTANIVNIALVKNVQKLVHISSIAALGKARDDELISETTKWKDRKTASNYAKSKYAAEMEVWRGMAEGLKVVVLNPSVILGSGFWNQGTCEMFRMYSKGFPFYTSGSMGFVDVRDVARLAIAAMKSAVSGEQFLLSGENLSYQNLFGYIAKVAGAKAPTFKMSPFLGGMAWRLEWLKSKFTGISPLITKETVAHASEKSHYNNQKSIETFGFQYTPIAQTIEETVAQLKIAAQNGLAPKVLPLN